MTKKDYLAPEMEVWPIQLEGPLCTSGETNELDDFTLITGGDIEWDSIL